MVFHDRTYSVLLVSSNDKFTHSTLSFLPNNNYYPVATAGSVGEARRRLSVQSYDLVLINTPLPDDFGTRLAVDLSINGHTGVILFVKGEFYNSVYAKVVEYGIPVISKPTSPQLLTQTLHILCATCERIRRMEAKQAAIEEQMEDLRLVNRAKWLLIEQRGLTEDEAHHQLERIAMDLRISKREAAQTIIKNQLD